jgi:hypothetical protein
MTDDLNLGAKSDEIETALRSVGVYVDRAHWQDPKEMMKAAAGATEDEELMEQAKNAKTPFILTMECFVGDVAFTDRVQNPVQHSMDDEFRSITLEFREQEFKETQEKIRQALAEGRNPFEPSEEQE